jgi:multidrug efflux pump subunit AcrB
MVELANQIREQEGVDRQTAILKAAPQRFTTDYDDSNYQF